MALVFLSIALFIFRFFEFGPQFGPFRGYCYCSKPIMVNVYGVIAQLVERLVRNEKVSGSTPLSSTTLFSVTTEKRQVLVFPGV